MDNKLYPKVTKKLLRAFTPRNLTLATMIRRDPKFKTKTPNQLLGEILHQELVERDVTKSLSHKMTKSVALNATPSIPVESSSKAIKQTKEESSDGGSTDEEMALVMRDFKKRYQGGAHVGEITKKGEIVSAFGPLSGF